MDVLIEFVPKVLCTLIDDYRTKCHDCKTYLIDEFICNTCDRTRCQYCDYINANPQACVICQNELIHIIIYDPTTKLKCISCNAFAYYGIIDYDITYCFDHIPLNQIAYIYNKFCDKQCVGTGIFINKQNGSLYCSQHAKSHGVLTRYTTIKN